MLLPSELYSAPKFAKTQLVKSNERRASVPRRPSIKSTQTSQKETTQTQAFHDDNSFQHFETYTSTSGPATAITMVSFNLILTAVTLATVAVASPASRALKRQTDCQDVRNAIATNNWPCTEVNAPSCEFCCESWLNLAGAFGNPPCHEDHGDFECPSGSEGFHCAAD